VASFKVGINMAGAISAGAYTAGVLDFLTEALDEWYKAKARGDAVPTHDISLEVFSGASAGGMCAAISAVMLQEDFEHIHDTSRLGTTNRFYESWVNKIDIRELLKADDLKNAQDVVSLLDSSILSQIASFALTPSNPLPSPRPYVSPNLTLFLSLTNLRGEPYSLNGAAPGSIEETTFFYGDRIRFETVRSDKTSPQAPSAHAIDLTQPGVAGGWDLLQTAAMATGAFPLFLAPRILPRKVGDYTPPMWESVASAVTGTPPPIAPNFPPGLPQPFATLNVDGGITNNDPFNYAHDYLVSLDPPSATGQRFVGPRDADRAVIGIAPFPTTDGFDISFDPAKNSDIFSVLPRLLAALISQSRFFGESLNQIMTGTTFSRFIIAPSDDELVSEYHTDNGTSPRRQPPALQCATLGAFGGFFERGFRAHDYALGRRNCQKFLRDYFVLPANNVIIKPALDALDPTTRATVIDNFKRPAPASYIESAKGPALSDSAVSEVRSQLDSVWIPIIPLCTAGVSEPIPSIPRAQISNADLKLIVKLILKRFRAVVSVLLTQVSSWPLRIFLRIGQPAIAWLARRPLREALIKQLGDSYRPSP
jgi:Patatin-like phospholipase